MLTIALLFVACGLCGLAFLFLLIFGLIKRRTPLILGAIAALIIAVGCGLSAVYLTAHKALQAAVELSRDVRSAMKPRTGSEIYAAFFDETPPCVTVTDHRDQVVPVMDTYIALRMNTCPAEIQRILSMAPYTTVVLGDSVNGVIHLGGPDGGGAFAHETLGDSVNTYYWEVQPGRNWRWMYVSRDSTEAIMVDVLD